MKKIILLLVFAALFIFLTSPAVADLANTNISLKVGDVNGYVNGSPEKLAVAPYLKNNSIMVPMSLVFENLGITTQFNSKTKTVTINNGKTVIKIVLGNKAVNVNGKTKILAVAPEIKNGQTMVPLNFFSDYMGISAKYFKDYQTISIANVPNFHFKIYSTDSWKFLLPEGWQAKQDERCELTVKGEQAGYVFNKYWLKSPPGKIELQAFGKEYINKVNGKVLPDTVLSDTNIYSAEFEYKANDTNGKLTDYTAFIKVEPVDNAYTYVVQFRPKGITVKREIREKVYISSDSVKEKTAHKF